MAIKLRKKTNNSALDKFLESLELNSYAADAVIKKLKEELNLHSVNRLRGVYYFFTFKMDENKRKIIHNLYIKRSRARPFVKITKSEMITSGAHPNEFKVFLEEIKAKKFDKLKEFFEKI